MDHDLESIIARLEILEMGICNILQSPGNIGNGLFLCSHILEILEISVWIGDMSGCVYNLCFAVEPPRRGFFLAKKSIFRNFGHGHFSKNEFSSKTRFLGH